ncbi:MAG: copper resistance CopC family protein [Arthrobacter sp.]|uniref:copper resistance CopC family protein n=1 Tax=unclassified Arthrobacter TaxID=235627 RepID=UPI00265354C4|nr:copper resistance protein CopC [Micrococcaceae bacterium]MDN5812774.1 copper resistance protein CopC [Micrococcaceae bacterium]MDN5824450.1 copper resistance protein CopC [Micrococcaceae bacterium]MDN5879099.1 copper resistance protein CopC [Micrococcaceae bacterium]MDN5887459.1 copper resistance protein CopC [Micrococcaceae bacterium]
MNTEHPHAPRTAVRQRPGTLRAILAAAAAALLMGLALSTAPAALAHDSLIGSTPKNGATVTEPLDSVDLNFSGELKSIGTEVSLADAEGKKYDADTSVSRNVLTVDFGQALPAGDYTLTWRAVSSDGHPIEGTSDNNEALTFTVEGGEAEASTPSSSPATGSSSAAEGTQNTASSAPAAQDTSATQAPDEQASSDGGLPTALIWVILAVAVIAAAGVVFAKVRRQSGSGK